MDSVRAFISKIWDSGNLGKFLIAATGILIFAAIAAVL